MRQSPTIIQKREKMKERGKTVYRSLPSAKVGRSTWRNLKGNRGQFNVAALTRSRYIVFFFFAERRTSPLPTNFPPLSCRVSDSCYFYLHRQRRAFTMARISETTGADIKVTAARRAYNKRVTHGRFRVSWKREEGKHVGRVTERGEAKGGRKMERDQYAPKIRRDSKILGRVVTQFSTSWRRPLLVLVRMDCQTRW